MPGTISAHEFIMKCLRDGKEVTGFHFIHKVCHDVQPEPPMADSYTIYGEPDLKVTIEGMIPGVESFATSTAPSINLIPQCVEAEAGWKDALDLPASKPVLKCIFIRKAPPAIRQGALSISFLPKYRPHYHRSKWIFPASICPLPLYSHLDTPAQ